MEFPTVWKDNSPPSLVDIAIRCCINDLSILLDYTPNVVPYKLKEDISLPREICDKIIQMASCEMNDTPIHSPSKIHHILQLFQDPIRTRLSHVNLKNTRIRDSDLELITQHNVTELNISNCSLLSADSFQYINRLKSSLTALIIGNTTSILPTFESDETELSIDFLLWDDMSHCELDSKYMLDAPRLRKFVLEGFNFFSLNKYLYLSLQNMKLLTYLDLSSCKNVYKLKFLKNHQHLLSLILYNVQELHICLDSICTITSLRHLDISQPGERHVSYKNPNMIMKSLVASLPNLTSLDISGTNLAGDRVQEHEEDVHDSTRNPGSSNSKSNGEDLVTDIAGLKGRVTRPLDFLGLYETEHQACYRHHIPAKKISGDANEEQILIAGQKYCGRSEVVQKVLNDLFHIFRFSTCNNIRLALDVIMESMRQHIKEKHIQISGSASLFYIVKGKEKGNFNIRIKKSIIKTLLDAMLEHTSDFTMIRNGCLTLIHFKIPDDVLFYYERLVDLLLIIISQDDRDEFVQRIGVYLLNSIACQVDGVHKELVGERGAITAMLTLISKRLSQQVCDEVMETAWSTMWNVTDETPVNCQRFLDSDGMNKFLLCLETFPEKAELLRNMMGLLGNVAEVKELRPYLMTIKFLAVFSDLLDNRQDGIEVSYNAAGILSHIAADGPALWEEQNIPLNMRRAILNRMVQAIDGWNLDTKRNINYRSFEPILRLLYDTIAPEAQYWAIWALANLTRVYPEKYCPLLKKENGLSIIDKHSKFHHYPPIRELAGTILEQCTRFEKGEVKDEEEERSIVRF